MASDFLLAPPASIITVEKSAVRLLLHVICLLSLATFKILKLSLYLITCCFTMMNVKNRAFFLNLSHLVFIMIPECELSCFSLILENPPSFYSLFIHILFHWRHLGQSYSILYVFSPFFILSTLFLCTVSLSTSSLFRFSNPFTPGFYSHDYIFSLLKVLFEFYSNLPDVSHACECYLLLVL